MLVKKECQGCKNKTRRFWTLKDKFLCYKCYKSEIKENQTIENE